MSARHRRARQAWFIAAFALVALAVVLAWQHDWLPHMADGMHAHAPAGTASSTAVPAELPAITLIDIKGNKIALQNLRGKVLVVNFWSTSCAPCLKEMPLWAQTRQEFGPRGLEVIAVAMQMDAPNYVIEFAQSRQLPFPVALDITGEASRAFGGVQAIPTSFLISRDGHIARKFIGMPSRADLQSALRQLL